MKTKNQSEVPTLTERETQGIEAIIYLQGMVAIDESKEKALRGWRGMSQHDQDFTLEFYGRMKKK